MDNSLQIGKRSSCP